jgi:hypothetical protein
MNNEDLIQNLKKQTFEYKSEIDINIIEKCQFIVEVGALTVGTDNKGVVLPQNVRFPMQFTQKAVDDILTMNWENGNGEKIMPIVYKKNNWYREKLKIIEESIEILEKIKI